mmetsp:Transcript_104877/g.296682  ORF Transcript_104877/g.296682 Transcript_104877/m.296682 type:complete len:240 (-) Transcript_104877:1155-1874(-)
MSRFSSWRRRRCSLSKHALATACWRPASAATALLAPEASCARVASKASTLLEAAPTSARNRWRSGVWRQASWLADCCGGSSLPPCARPSRRSRIRCAILVAADVTVARSSSRAFNFAWSSVRSCVSCRARSRRRCSSCCRATSSLLLSMPVLGCGAKPCCAGSPSRALFVRRSRREPAMFLRASSAAAGAPAATAGGDRVNSSQSSRSLKKFTAKVSAASTCFAQFCSPVRSVGTGLSA